MAHYHVLLDGTGSSGDGSTWNDDSSGTAAYIGTSGLSSILGSAVAGDFIWVKGNGTSSSVTTFRGPLTAAALTDPVKVLGVKTGTTNLGASIVQSDLIPGVRTGQSTRAYDWGGGTVPKAAYTGSSGIEISGGLFIYGVHFSAMNSIAMMSSLLSRLHLDECHFELVGTSDKIIFSGTDSTPNAQEMFARRCRFHADSHSAHELNLQGYADLEFFECDIDSADSIELNNHFGHAAFNACDLSDVNATLFDITGADQSNVELNHCKLPASHVMTSGTATGRYRIINRGSEDSTALGSTDSEQAYEVVCQDGTITNSTINRSGGAGDGATGAFTWALVPSDVTDGYSVLRTEWCQGWIEGDGTSKTATWYLANSDAEAAANLLETDEFYIEVMAPSEAGDSLYDTFNSGEMQLLGTPADLTATSETWDSGANNDQSVSVSFAPDYQGPFWWRAVYSKDSGPTVYLEITPVIT